MKHTIEDWEKMFSHMQKEHAMWAPMRSVQATENARRFEQYAAMCQEVIDMLKWRELEVAAIKADKAYDEGRCLTELPEPVKSDAIKESDEDDNNI